MATDAIPRTPSEGVSPPLKFRLALAGLMTVMALAVIEYNIVNTSLPRIVSDLGGMSRMAWAVTAFLLASTIAAPLYGKLSDLYGRRSLMVVSIGIFLLGSILSGVAASMTQLIAFRAVQGLGAGGLITLVQTSVGDLVAPARRAHYQTYFTTVFALSSLAGPLIGGALTTWFSWRWIFYFNVPIGVLALGLVLASLPSTHIERRPTIDLAGAFLLAVFTTALLTAFGSGGSGQAPLVTLAFAAVAVTGFFLFLRQERRAAEPILDLALFENRTFSIGVIATATMSFGLIAALVLLPLYLQLVTGRSPIQAALIVTPQMLGIILISLVSARLTRVVGHLGRVLLVGIMLQTVALWGLVIVTGFALPVWIISVVALMLGMGMGIGMPNAVAIVQNAVGRHQLGVATGALSFFRSLGGAAGVTLSGGVVTFVLHRTLGAAPFGMEIKTLIDHGERAMTGLTAAQHLAYADAYRQAIEGGFALCALVISGALVSVLALPEVVRRKDGR